MINFNSSTHDVTKRNCQELIPYQEKRCSNLQIYEFDVNDLDQFMLVKIWVSQDIGEITHLQYKSVIMASVESLTSHLSSSTTIIDLTAISHEKVHKISSLSRFINLKVLNLSNQRIAKIQNIPSMVTSLNLQFNQIIVLENIDHLIFLQQLYLSCNIIAKIETLENNKNLRILELAHNQLQVQSIGKLVASKEINILTLQGNPLIQQISYKTILGMFMKSLFMVDKQPLKRDFVFFGDKSLNSCLREVVQQNQTPSAQIKSLKLKNSYSDEAIEIKITKLKIQNLKIIEEIIRKQQKADELSKQYSKSKHSIQEAQLLELIQIKYEQSLILQQELKQLECIQNPTIPEQKARNALLEKLITNQENLQFYQKQLQKIRTSSQFQTIKSQTSERSINVYYELNIINSDINNLRKKLKFNESLISEYSNQLNYDLEACRQTKHVQLMKQLVFGEQREVNNSMLDKLCSKYQQGLLNLLADMAGVMFGNEPSFEKIRELKESLNGRALLDWFCQKNRTRKRQKKFLKEKQNFILEFQKQTQDLFQNWQELRKAEEKFQLRVKKFQENQIKQEQQLKQKLQQILDNHHLNIKKQMQKHNQILNEVKLQTTKIGIEKQKLQIQIYGLNQQKNTLANLKAQLQKVKHQIRKKKLELQQISSTSQSTILHNQSVQKKSFLLSQKCNQKYSQFLHAQGEYKVLQSKLSILDAEHVQVKHELQESKYNLLEVRRNIIDEQKMLQRAKNGVTLLQSKLQNLNKLINSKKVVLQTLEKQIGAFMDYKKKRSFASASEEELLIQGSIFKKRNSSA